MFLTTWQDSIIDVRDNTHAGEVADGHTKTLGLVVRDGLSRRYVSIGVTAEQLDELRRKLADEMETGK